MAFIRMPMPANRHPSERDIYSPPGGVTPLLFYLNRLEESLSTDTDLRRKYEQTLRDTIVLVVLRGCAAFRATHRTDSRDRKDLFQFLGMPQSRENESALWDVVARSGTWKEARNIPIYLREAVRRTVERWHNDEGGLGTTQRHEAAEETGASEAKLVLSRLAEAEARLASRGRIMALATRARMSVLLRRRLERILEDGWEAVAEDEREYLVAKLRRAV